MIFVENIRKTKASCTKYLGFALKILSKATVFEKIHKFYDFQKFSQEFSLHNGLNIILLVFPALNDLFINRFA